MARAAKAGSIIKVIRERMAEITAWQAEGLSPREIAKRLKMSESSYRGARKRLEATMQTRQPPEVYAGISSDAPAVQTQVYEGIPLSQPDAVRIVLEETHTLLPALRTMAQDWPSVKAMLQDWLEQRQLYQISPAYQPYDGFYSCRLNGHLIAAIKEYAAQHRLSQSELVTLALQSYLEQHR
jgi:predicted DNA binding CopG/RHH family protein